MTSLWGFVCILGFVGSVATAQLALVNRATYTFQNKGDLGFLTAVGGQRSRNHIAISDRWRDGPAQKWQVVKGYLGSSYMFKPTSDDKNSIFSDGHMIGVGHSGFALSSSQYWTVWESEQGFFNIRSTSSDECLESAGLGKQLVTSRCRNIREQQWAMHRR